MSEHLMTDSRWSELEQMHVFRLSSIHWREIKAHVYAQKKRIINLEAEIGRLMEDLHHTTEDGQAAHAEWWALSEDVGRIRRHVVRLVQEGAITASRGAEVLGMTTMEFRAVSNAVADEHGTESEEEGA